MMFIRSAVFSVIAISLISACALPYVQADDQANQQVKNNLIKELQREKEKQISHIEDLQKKIQQTMSAVDDIKEKEKLFRQNLLLEEAKLVTFEASRKAAFDRTDKEEHLPIEVLTLNDPELKELDVRKEKIQEQRELVAQMLKNPSADARIQQYDKQIKDIDDRIKLITDGADKDNVEGARKRIRMQEDLHLHSIEQKIREQKILVDMLKAKYEAQRGEKFNRTRDMLAITSLQSQINRANKLIEEIDCRILALQVAPYVDNTQDTAGQSQIDRANKILEQIDNRIRSLQTHKPEVSAPANPPTVQDQLRQMNERLERIESLLESLNRKQ